MTLQGQQVFPPPSMPSPTVHTERSGANSPSIFTSKHVSSKQARVAGRKRIFQESWEDTVRSFVKMTDIWKSNLIRKELHHFPFLTSLPQHFCNKFEF